MWTLVGAALIVGITIACYLPAMMGGFVWDDDYYVTDNETLKTGEGLKRIWLEPGATIQYYPLAFTTFWIEYHLWEFQPFGYHLVNVLLHALGALLLWLVLRRLSIPGAWLAAAVFALHPVHVESVAWITERKNVLSGVFYLSALLCYARFANLGGASPAKAFSWRLYLPALGLFLCALLSKTVTCTLPAAVILLLWWKRDRLCRRDVWPLLPFFALGLVMGLVTIWMEMHNVGAKHVDWGLSFLDRCLIAGRALWFYPAKLLWPFSLTFIYPRWEIDSAVWWQYLYPLAAVTAVLVLWRIRNRIGSAPLVAILVYAGTLGPALGFISVFPMRYSFVADHFQYLASIALITLVVATATKLLSTGKERAETAPTSRRSPSLISTTHVLFAAALLGTLGTLTWYQGKIYRDPETLWRDTLVKNPNASMAHINLGNILDRRGDWNEAIPHFRAVIQADPPEPDLTVVARAYYNLGNTLGRQGKIDEAIEAYQESLRVDPRYYNAYHGLGWAFQRQDRVDESIEAYSEFLRVFPDHAAVGRKLDDVLAHKARLAKK
jgi:tetratricopeptide (TPR) repeat protein